MAFWYDKAMARCLARWRASKVVFGAKALTLFSLVGQLWLLGVFPSYLSTSPSPADATLSFQNTTTNLKKDYSGFESLPNECALYANGSFDTFQNFFPDDISRCPWIDYAGKILRKRNEKLTLVERQQKEDLLNRKSRNVLVVGDSQDRNMVEYVCVTAIDSNLTVIPARWVESNGTEMTAPIGSSTRDERHNFRVCRAGRLTVANFFHFGFIGGSKWAYGHVSNGEPIDVLDRIENMLPRFMKDAFGTQQVQLDSLVINSALWDLLAISYQTNWKDEIRSLPDTCNTWHRRAREVGDKLQALAPNAPIIWRNAPHVGSNQEKHTSEGQQVVPFTSSNVKLINNIGTAFAHTQHWPVLDLRGPLLPLAGSALKQDGFHINQKGWKLYLNRILNAIMTYPKHQNVL